MQSFIKWLFLLWDFSLLWPSISGMQVLNSFYGQTLLNHQRSKRSWVWNQLFVLEEQTITNPVSVGQIKSDMDKQDGTVKYVLSGDGAKTVFTIDENSGVIYVLKKLDREVKGSYTLRAQAINSFTGVPVEPESEFIIKVLDINDHEPKFITEPYVTTIPEMSPEGTSVIQVTATDLDDPSYGINARLIYSILQGQPHFSIEPTSGIIRVASQIDREAKDQYHVIIQAKDLVGQMGGLSATTTVTIHLSDVNDNAPKFQQKIYDMSILESSLVGEIVGTVIADDRDIGENAEMIYMIEEKGDYSTFDIFTDHLTQEGIITLKKVVDYESKKKYIIKVKAVNKHFDERFIKSGTLEDTTTIKIYVEDVDEPPVFTRSEFYMEILENADCGSFVGSVSARDPDAINRSIRYYIAHKSYFRIFEIDELTGAVITVKGLDRELSSWHNITVAAKESKNAAHVSEVSVYIRVIDVNDHAPQLLRKYDINVCEMATDGKVIETISAVDEDKQEYDHLISFALAPESTSNENFTIRDNGDNTAAIISLRDGYRREEETFFYLSIEMTDNGSPPLTSTSTLTISVCDCGADMNTASCKKHGFLSSVGLNSGALISLSLGVPLILVLIVLFIIKQRKNHNKLSEKEEFRENFVSYDDEGGGEADTEAFDIVRIRNPTIMRQHKPKRNIRRDIPSLYRLSLGFGPDVVIFRQFLSEKLEEANSDIASLSLDTVHRYVFEGTGSVTGSLSSIESIDSDTDLSNENICEWGPHFQKIANICMENKTKEKQTT
ncbi:cadherin-19-like [Bombina bombina]|uniref:cadherin-19-like n=1 Tax=Bombina bombina TaxID=8345 RepID=UPI00235AA3D5|nr:cadherin-19-like [Bombina bombina]